METSTSSQVTAITPVLTKDVSFTDKVQDVETALKSRSAAQRDIKTKWAAVVKLLQEHDLSVPYRRPDPSTVVGYVRQIDIYQPKAEVPAEVQAMLEYSDSYEVRQFLNCQDAVKAVNKQFAGFAEWVDKVCEARKLAAKPRELDKDATQKAREEMSAAVDAYLAAIEAYDETLDSVSNVKEYIGIMKEIADISAIAQGIKTNN